MHKFASGESFCAANDQEKKLRPGNVLTVLVDQKSGRLDIIANLTRERSGSINQHCGELSESSASTNGHFDPSQSCPSDTTRPGRRNFRRPRFVACIVFLVDAETCVSGQVEARELLVIDHELKPANMTMEMYEKMSVESMHRHSDSVPLEEACILQGPYSDSEHSSSKALGICNNNLNTREYLTLLSKQTIHLDLDAQVAGLLSVTLRNSPALFPGFLGYSRHHSRLFMTNKHVYKESVQLSSRSYRHVIVHLMYPQKVFLDLLWFFRLEALLVKHAMLDDLMNWLSTLGGAYSSLGDHFLHHAENAAEISMKQLRIAIEMGSPPLIIRCCLFYSLSLMQRGQLQRAKNIIREQYRAAKALPITDDRLLAMCQGIWNRLRYLWQKNRNHVRSQKTSSVNVQEHSLR